MTEAMESSLRVAKASMRNMGHHPESEERWGGRYTIGCTRCPHHAFVVNDGTVTGPAVNTRCPSSVRM